MAASIPTTALTLHFSSSLSALILLLMSPAAASSPLAAPSPSHSSPPSSFSPSSLGDLLSSLLSDLTSIIRDHTVSLFFFFLLLTMILWLVGFNFLFTKQCISAVFRSFGVSSIRTKAAFAELRRKSFHLCGLIIPAVYYTGLKYFPWLLTPRVAAILLGVLCTFLWIIEFLRLISPSFRLLYNAVFGAMLRKSETARESTQFTGTGFFFLGNFLCVLFFAPSIAVCASLFLVLGDMSAAIVGISFGRIKIGKKSLEGSLAMFFCCFVIGAILYWHVPLAEYVIFSGALAATLTELLAPSVVDDNLSIPVATALALHLAFRRIGISPPDL